MCLTKDSKHDLTVFAARSGNKHDIRGSEDGGKNKHNDWCCRYDGEWDQ